MPLILIDVSRLLYRQLRGMLPTGIDRVSIEYVRHYGSQARAVLALGPFAAVMSARDSRRMFDRLLERGPEAAGSGRAAWFMLGAVLGRWLWWPRGKCVLFNLSHSGLRRPWYAWALRRAGVRVVVMVHDLIPISHPEYFPLGARRTHERRMAVAARIAQAVVTNSRATRDAFKAFCQAQGLAVPPLTVALLAPGLPPQPRALDRSPAPVAGAPPLDGAYFVMLGTIEPRKNHWLLLQVWRKLAERLGDEAPKLVVIGTRGWECENVVDLLERCHALEGKVIELGRCPDAQMLPYLLHCRALLYPSMIEGYGMPVAEALTLGVPVIASDIPVFHEFAGQVPDFADPLDGRRWEALVCDYARADSPLRAAQLQRMAFYQVPTWEQHFAKVDEALAEWAPKKVASGLPC